MKEEIQSVEAKIEEAKKGREKRRREQLAELFINLEGGTIFKIAVEKNAQELAKEEAKANMKRKEERAQAVKTIH
ncbi:MAG: hypothetical protein ACK55Z_06965 [bacterium]